tara:strand:- start:404 stop:1009 length:606 start_codon:yes stop_codon:yes gene_type:complete
MKILIINAGGNVLSLKNILNHCGYESKIYSKEDNLSLYDVIFLPGIGAYDQVIKNLKKIDVFDKLQKLILLNKIYLIGICVGMQILFESSEEGKLKGLNLIPGKVKKFKKLDGSSGLHMGWNTVSANKNYSNLNNKKFYFAHNYYVECNENFKISTSDHILRFPSIVKKNKIIGIQFHPEKSHVNGIDLLKYLLNEICKDA